MSKINNLKIEKFIVFERFLSDKGVVRSFFFVNTKNFVKLIILSFYEISKTININDCVLILFEVLSFYPIHVYIPLLFVILILCPIIRTCFA